MPVQLYTFCFNITPIPLLLASSIRTISKPGIRNVDTMLWALNYMAALNATSSSIHEKKGQCFIESPGHLCVWCDQNSKEKRTFWCCMHLKKFLTHQGPSSGWDKWGERPLRVGQWHTSLFRDCSLDDGGSRASLAVTLEDELFWGDRHRQMQFQDSTLHHVQMKLLSPPPPPRLLCPKGSSSQVFLEFRSHCSIFKDLPPMNSE